jgi:hypothetical protein
MLVKTATCPPSRVNPRTQLRLKQWSSPRLWLAALLLVLHAEIASATEISAESPWQRIVMVGASATAGFTASEPLGGSNTPMYRLSRYVEAALTVAHEPVQNLGTAFFFLQPQLFAQQQIAQALTNKPTLIIGVDFLFWFCYGEGSTDKERLQRFDQGLKLLETIKCPLVVGDIPDASAAVNKMLRPDQMPSLKAIAAANQRLKEWAATREQVAIIGLSEFMRNATTNRAIKIRDYTLPDGQTRGLLQDDDLHASPSGCAVLALAVMDAFQTTRSGVIAEEFRRDPKEIFQLVLRSSNPAPNGASKPSPPIRPTK